jgi:hypothetical protein
MVFRRAGIGDGLEVHGIARRPTAWVARIADFKANQFDSMLATR